MIKSKAPKPPVEEGDFARAVVALFQWNISNEIERSGFKGNTAIEVRQCANGLGFLWQSAAKFMKDNTLAGGGIAASGVAEAFAILDHLTTGKAHPIAKHIAGIHSGSFRPQRAPANEFARLVQRIVVGAVRAVQTNGGKGQNAAIRDVVAGLERAGSEFTPTSDQIKAWYHVLTAADDKGPDVFAAEIIRRARQRQTSVLREAIRLIFEHTAVAGPTSEASQPV